MIGLVYKATNRLNGLVYIGSTARGLNIRKGEHFSGNGCKEFHEALDYYGFDAFAWEIICVSDNIYDVRREEKRYIEKFETYKPEFGYNLLRTGNLPNEQVREKISNSLRGKKKPPRSEEHRRNHSESLKGYKQSDEHKQKISMANKGKKNCLGYKQSDEHKQNVSNALKGKNKGPKTEETKRKISESVRRYYERGMYTT